METIRVDFNSLGRGGMLRAHLGRASGPLSVGEHVLAVDGAEDMEFEAVVSEIEDGTQVVWLDVLWTENVEPTVNVFFGSVTSGAGTPSMVTGSIKPYYSTVTAEHSDDLLLPAAG